MTKTLAVYLGSLLLMLLTVWASARASRTIELGDYPLARIPATCGDWTWDKAATPANPSRNSDLPVESLRRYRTYRNNADQQVQVTLRVTSSRIGALRNYTVALIGEGWAPRPPDVWEATLEGLPFPVRASHQVLTKGAGRMETLNWFVAPGQQALGMEEAVLRGWRARLAGNPLWGQVFLYMIGRDDDPTRKEALTDLARHLFPSFYEVLCDYAQTKLGGSPAAGERN